jgi:hypothetical protein
LPVGHFGCDPDTWREYSYPESSGPGSLIVAKSPQADPQEAYCFKAGHCGLDWVVDFDGSFWRVGSWDSAERPSSLINGELGKIRLVGPDEAEFTAWQPEGVTFEVGTGHVDHIDDWTDRVTLERINGPIVLEVCY